MLKFSSLHFLPMLGLLAASPAHAADDAAAKAEAAYNNACRTCHSVKPGDNRLGPSLGGVVGRKAGQVEGFNYSPGTKTAEVTWDAKTLDAFIANPDAVIPGNKMKPYTGISDAAVRASVLEFLSSKK
jgi:cytochrome c